MPAPDARTRNKISLNPAKVLASSLPSKFLPRIFLSNLVFVFALHASKDWLLKYEIGVFWLVMRVLACGGLGAIVWEVVNGQITSKKNIEWPVLGMASVLLFVQQGCLFTALYRLTPFRVIFFTHFSSLWMTTFIMVTSTKKAAAVAFALILSILSDAQFSTEALWRLIPGYGALVIHGFASTALDHTYGVLSPSLGTNATIAGSVLGATVLSLPFYLFRSIVLNLPPAPFVPLLSLAVIPVAAYSILFLTPSVAHTLGRVSFTTQHFALSYPTIAVSAILTGTLVFTHFPSWTDFVVAGLLYAGAYPETIDAFSGPPKDSTSRLLKSYMKTILSNPESRKIFYFLMLNMCYMLVQMLYGVWTNSLGLISDAIHMAFDCMAIGVGLFASVMATWDPNERFTYGYGRIETLSGFANGVFLILISIFIIFEAIQRIMEPPEMNTSQLLLVSTLGLGVNLFGMFAMGGHHHHGGHSHSHGHGHSHSLNFGGGQGGHDHGHSHSEPSTSINSSHSHSHSHSHLHSAPDPEPPHIYDSHPADHHGHTHDSHSRSHSHAEHSHSPSHSHSEPSHSHSHSPAQDVHDVESRSHPHSHSHDEHDGHDHSHSSGNSHDISTKRVHTHQRSSSQSPAPVLAHFAKAPGSNGKRQFRGAAIKTHHDQPLKSLVSPHLAHLQMAQEVETPLTPSYSFGHDDHYAKHHEAEHAPNAHDHAHAPSHEGHSHNMRGVFLHVMADTLGSVGVIISTLLIQFYGWTGFDPIASLFIAVLIAASVVPLVMDTGRVLCLDVLDNDETIQRALLEVSSIEGLSSYSNARFWPKDANSLIGSIHVQLAPSAASYDPAGPHSSQRTAYARIDRVVERVDSLLRKKIPNLEELTIQVGPSLPDN